MKKYKIKTNWMHESIEDVVKLIIFEEEMSKRNTPYVKTYFEHPLFKDVCVIHP